MTAPATQSPIWQTQWQRVRKVEINSLGLYCDQPVPCILNYGHQSCCIHSPNDKTVSPIRQFHPLSLRPGLLWTVEARELILPAVWGYSSPTQGTESLCTKTSGSAEGQDRSCEVVDITFITKGGGTLKVTMSVFHLFATPGFWTHQL